MVDNGVSVIESGSMPTRKEKAAPKAAPVTVADATAPDAPAEVPPEVVKQVYEKTRKSLIERLTRW